MNNQRDLMPMVNRASPFWSLQMVRMAIDKATAQGLDVNGRMAITLPDEFDPLIRLREGLALLENHRQNLVQEFLDLRAKVAEVSYTTVGLQYGDFVHAQGFRPNPELQTRLQERARQLRRSCAEPLRIVRLLGHFGSLGGLLFAVEAESRQMESAGSDPELGLVDAEEYMKTTPGRLQKFGIPSVMEPFDVLIRAMGKVGTKNRRGRKRRIAIPSVLQPRPYADGMRLIWTLTEDATQRASTIAEKVSALCLAILRTILGENMATGSSECPELAADIRLTGIALTTILEDICRTARLLWDKNPLDECLQAQMISPAEDS